MTRLEAFKNTLKGQDVLETHNDIDTYEDLFELVREVLHALADDMEDNESYAVNGIARFRDAANSIPEDEEYFN